MKTKKGSTLVLLVVIMAIVTTIGFALIGLTYNEYRMGMVSKNKEKAYYSAEAGVERISLMLDKKVVEAQEAASIIADAQIKALLLPIETSPLRDAYGNVNTEALDSLYRTKYLEAFYSVLDDTDGFFRNINNQDNLNYLMDCDLTSIEASFFLDEEGLSKASLLTASYDQIKRSVTVVVRGDYLGKVNDLDVPYQKLSVDFNVLPDPEEVPYQAVASSSVVQAEIPNILSKTLLAEKNIVSAGGKVNVSGDVLAFGTIPSTDGKEAQNAEGHNYGGIMAGIPNVSSLNMNGSGKTFDEYFDFDTSKTGTMISGSINITSNGANGLSGDAATMAYIHTLYSSYDSPSEISVQGSAFARTIKAEADGIYSNISLGDAYTSDNLQIDSDESLINVNGAYYGFVTASYDIDGGVGAVLEDSYKYKNTSSIVINGDSKINLNGTSSGGVYVGGSSFFGTMVDSAYYPLDSRPYMTGVSALKAGARLSTAFEEQNALNGETRLYTGANSYLANSEISMKPYNDIEDPNNVTVHNMFDGRAGNFILQERAAHFKGLWEEVWSKDEVYSSYVDTDAINIKVDSDDKINGYALGSIVANGKVYGQGNFKGIVDAANFGLMQKGTDSSLGWIEAFHNEIKLLLAENYDRTKPKLNYINNSKHIIEYLDTALLNNYTSPVTIFSLGEAQGIMYYSNSDCNITYDGANWLLNGRVMQLNKGIIVSTGNVYIQGGFNFNGAILTSKNIVFTGASNISYDGSVIKNMLLDLQLSKLFKQTRGENNITGINGQRISQKNIKITNWTKIP